MRLALAEEQSAIVASAVEAVRRSVASADDEAAAALRGLQEGGFLDLSTEVGQLEAALVTEAVARLGVLSPVGAQLLVKPGLGIDESHTVGLLEGRDAIVRFGLHADVFIGVEGDKAFIAGPGEATVTPLQRSMGTPGARVRVDSATALSDEQSRMVIRRWRIAMAAEAAGAMAAAIELTVPYVSQRIAFGRPLGSFQAVQHRLARAQVLAQGTSWLMRHAAWTYDSDYLAAAAATYTCQAAQQIYENTHQVTGGTGITTEHGLARHTRRLTGLQRELGGVKAHARAVTAARQAMRAHTPVAAAS